MRVRTRKPITFTKEKQARAAQEMADYAAKRRKAAERARPYNERVLTASGIPLRDIPAALDCQCGCHPRVDLELHDGGARCPCQLTAEERRELTAELFESLADYGRDQSDWVVEQRNALRQKADALGVKAEIACLAAPFVITGNVDGRGFYLRERHDLYRVTISGDDDPGANPWTDKDYSSQLDVVNGDSEDFADAGEALELAVAAVRTYLRQRTCVHPYECPDVRYCPNCGKAFQSASAV